MMKQPKNEKEALEIMEREDPFKERERRVAAAMENLKLNRWREKAPSKKRQ